MGNEMVVRENGSVPTVLTERAKHYREQSRAVNTMRSYRFDLEDFSKWCAKRALSFLPAAPETVAEYLVYLAEERGYKTSTIQRRVSAISQLHEAQKQGNPTKQAVVRDVLKGIRREHGTAQEGKKPLRTDDLRRIIEALPDNLLGLRDRALLLLGYAKACRRSELVGLNVEDLEFTREGIVVTLRRSKTDQEGEGQRYGIPYGSNPLTCPVRALQDWLEASGIKEGAAFRAVNRHGQLQAGRLSAKAVALVIKRSCERVGLDPEDYAGHSLRAGFATEAAARGVSERSIMAQTGHKSLNVVRRYIRSGQLFLDNAAAQVGL